MIDPNDEYIQELLHFPNFFSSTTCPAPESQPPNNCPTEFDHENRLADVNVSPDRHQSISFPQPERGSSNPAINNGHDYACCRYNLQSNGPNDVEIYICRGGGRERGSRAAVEIRCELINLVERKKPACLAYFACLKYENKCATRTDGSRGLAKYLHGGARETGYELI